MACRLALVLLDLRWSARYFKSLCLDRWLAVDLLLISLLDRFLEVEILLAFELCVLASAPQLPLGALDRRTQLLQASSK